MSEFSMASEEAQKMKELFHDDCYARSEEIDPDDEYDWHSLALGWAIAKGMKINDAQIFAYCV